MKITEKTPHFWQRCLLLVVGLTIMAFGVAFSIKASLGTSPISSLPYTLSVIVGPLTVGTATICLHCVLVLLQILLLRKQFEIFQLLQLVVAIIFGYVTDFAIWVISGVSYSAYWQQWIYCIIGILLVALGVSCEVTSRVTTLAGEGLVLAICRVTKLKFGNVKVCFDVSLVIIACILGLVFTGQLQGVREGTIAAAICVGLISKRFNIPLGKLEEKYLS